MSACDIDTAQKDKTIATQTATTAGGAAKPDASDFIGTDALLTDKEVAIRDEARAVVEERIESNAPEWWETAHSPREMTRVPCDPSRSASASRTTCARP